MSDRYLVWEWCSLDWRVAGHQNSRDLDRLTGEEKELGLRATQLMSAIPKVVLGFSDDVDLSILLLPSRYGTYRLVVQERVLQPHSHP